MPYLAPPHLSAQDIQDAQDHMWTQRDGTVSSIGSLADSHLKFLVPFIQRERMKIKGAKHAQSSAKVANHARYLALSERAARIVAAQRMRADPNSPLWAMEFAPGSEHLPDPFSIT